MKCARAGYVLSTALNAAGILMSYLNFDWLFGKKNPQAQPPGGVVCETGRETENKTQKIVIAGEDCDVTAHKTGRNSWKAYGYVKKMPVQAAGDTARAAFTHWRDLAKTLRDD
jgi:hypothetical protein